MTTRFKPRREDYTPEGAIKVTREGVKAEVFYYIDIKGKPAAIGFKGRAQKPTFHYYYATEERRAERVSDWFDSLAHAEAETIRRRKERNQPHTLKQGAILYASWGYEQTNVQFFEVAQVIGKNTVELVEIGTQTDADSGEGGSSMSDYVVADQSRKIGQAFRCKVNMSQGSPSVRVGYCAYASPWDGRRKYRSWYA